MNERTLLPPLLAALALGCQTAPLTGSKPTPRELADLASMRPSRTSATIEPDKMRKLEEVSRKGLALLKKAEAFFEKGRFAEAEAKCAAVNQVWESRGPNMNPEVAYLLGRIRMSQGRYADAVRIMEPNLDTTEIMHLDFALCLVKVGRIAEAQAFYNPTLIVRYNSAFGDVQRFLPDVSTPQRLEGGLLWCKAEALRMVGRRSEATDCFVAALERFPKNALLGAELGFHATNAHRDAEAVKGYRAVQASNDVALKQATREDASNAELRVKDQALSNVRGR